MPDGLKFGLLYIPDHDPDKHADFETFYEQMLEQVRAADELGFDSAWFAGHRLAGYGYLSPAIFRVAAAQWTRHLSAEFGLTHIFLEVFYGGLSHERVLRMLERFAAEVMPAFDHVPPPEMARPRVATRLLVAGMGEGS